MRTRSDILQPARAGGLTLAELVLGMAMTTIVAAAIATMLVGVSGATSAYGESRSLMVGHGLAASRIGAAVRNARALLAAGEGLLVLWDEREHSDGVPQLSELERIEWDPGTEELHSYKAPSDLPEALDVSYDLTATDFGAVTAALKGTESFPGRLWGVGVKAWTIHTDAADRLDVRFIGYRLVLETADASEVTVGGAALRNR